MKHPKFTLLFFLLFILQLVCKFYQIGNLQLIIRSLPVLSLLIWFINETRLHGRFHKRLFAGLLFALAGNVFFSYELIAVLACHLCYTAAFYLDFRSAPELDKKGARIAIIIVFIFCLSFYFYMRPYLGIVKLPLLASVIVVSLTLMMAAFRNERVNGTSFKLILMGSILLILSDVVFALNKFAHSFDYANILIIAIYIAAQYLITLGGIERQLINKG